MSRSDSSPVVERPRVALAGASGRIGLAVIRSLADTHELVALTRSPARHHGPQLPVAWRHCDLFARSEVEAALAGARLAVYLVHTRLPSARLDQARCEDMDILIADNFARAAARCGVEQIVCLRGPAPGERETASGAEVVEALSGHGVPVTVLHAGLVVGPGGAVMDLLERVVTRAPWLLLPRWAARRKQPVAVIDVARAIGFCLGNQSTYGRRFEIGGPDVMSTRALLEAIARAQGARTRVMTVPWLPPTLYVAVLRMLSPGSHASLARLVVEGLGRETVAGDSPVQRFVSEGALPIAAALSPASARETATWRGAIRDEDDAWLRKARTVRSIQRYERPSDRDARWLARSYFEWLPRFAWPLIACRAAPDGSVCIELRLPRLKLLELEFQPERSGPGRALFFITGGLLAARRGTRARMEFRDVLGGRYTIVAIHDYEPFLPWSFYQATQAAAHGVVMRAYRRHLARLERGAG